MNKRALITLGLFAGLGVLYLLSEQSTKGGGDALPTWQIPALKASADRIEIVREGETLKLEKTADAWKVVGAKSYPAAKTHVDGFLDLFEKAVGVDLKVPVSAEELERYELAGEKAIAVKVEGGGKTLVSFVVGKTVGSRTFVKPADETVVYRAKSSIRFKIDRKASEWREKKVFAIDRDDVVSMTLHHPPTQGADGATVAAVPITLDRDSEAKDGATTWKDTWRITSPVQEAADKSTASSLLGSIINVRAADFADDVSVADAGFGPGSFKVSVKLKEGKGAPQTLVFGGAVGEGRFEGKYTEDLFARSEGEDTVYVIRKYTQKNTAKSLAELRNKEVFAGLKREDITGLKLESGGAALSFAKAADKWNAVAPAELAGKLDESPLNSLLSSLANLRAARVLNRVDDTAGGFTPAARKVRVTLTTKSKGELVLLVGGLADEAKKEWYARLEDSPTPVWVLRDYVVRQMTKAAAGFKKKDKA
jgi:hypothetical protein